MMTIFLETVITGDDKTKAFGAAFAKCVAPQDLILLVGDLGAGKTTFVSGVVNALCPGEEATSPTFTLVHRYRGIEFDVMHADLWRLDTEKEILDLSIWEELEEGAVAFVEWGDKAGELLGIPDYLISFREYEQTSRLVRIFFPMKEATEKDITLFCDMAAAEAGIGEIMLQDSSERVSYVKAVLEAGGISVTERQIVK